MSMNMNKKQKDLFALSVVLTIVSIIAYTTNNIFLLILSSAAASYGYFRVCNEANIEFSMDNQEDSTVSTDDQNAINDDSSVIE